MKPSLMFLASSQILLDSPTCLPKSQLGSLSKCLNFLFYNYCFPNLIHVFFSLNDIVNGFDDVADRLGIEKIKTIGDAYFAVSGLHSNKNDHALKLLLFAINARNILNKVNRSGLPPSIMQSDQKYNITIRIGIHTGPVVGGVIGKSKFQYDVWGSTVNLASRMESTGLPGRIQVSRQTYERTHEDFKFEETDGVYAKGLKKFFFFEKFQVCSQNIFLFEKKFQELGKSRLICWMTKTFQILFMIIQMNSRL